MLEQGERRIELLEAHEREAERDLRGGLGPDLRGGSQRALGVFGAAGVEEGLAEGAQGVGALRIELHRALEEALPERDAFFAANERFHLRVLEIDGNRWRLQIVGDLRRLMKLNRHHSLFKQGRLQESLQEHREMLAALLERDADRAARLVRCHFDNGLKATGRAAD